MQVKEFDFVDNWGEEKDDAGDEVNEDDTAFAVYPARCESPSSGSMLGRRAAKLFCYGPASGKQLPGPRFHGSDSER
jgi:hypothetical protein